MLLYNIRIAAKSLRRNPYLTALLLGAIALGICVSTTFTTLRHAFAKDPLPGGKSHQLFYVRMDNWDPASTYPGNDPHGLPPQITYRDLRALLKSPIPTRQTASFQSALFIHPDPKVGPPYSDSVRMVNSDFFGMFDVPFQYGGPWDKAADAKPEPVVVIDDATNRKLFGGGNSVGKTMQIEDRNFKVIGVVAPWRPTVRFYDMISNFAAAPEAMYLPFNFTQPMQIRTTGNIDGWRNTTVVTFDDFLAADIDWAQLWVELPTAAKQQQYRQYIDDYVREEKKHGRFPRPLNNRLSDVMELGKEMGVVQPQMTAMAAVSLLFLIVCSLNLVGLLLGKFLARAPEVSVRRALGASRVQVFLQHIVECELVGVAGGVAGMILSLGVLAVMRRFSPGNIPIQLDAEMVISAVFLSLVAGLVAGVYPAWRICTMPPAGQLKLQ